MKTNSFNLSECNSKGSWDEDGRDRINDPIISVSTVKVHKTMLVQTHFSTTWKEGLHIKVWLHETLLEYA